MLSSPVGNPTFVSGRVERNGQLRAAQYASTGYEDNYFSVGPAMLETLFLVVTHLVALGVNRLGAASFQPSDLAAANRRCSPHPK